MSLSLSRNGAFMKLWIGETVSMIGSAVTMLALPLTAIKLLAATPFDMGALLACEAGAAALVGIFAGAIADRSARKPLLLLSNVLRAIVIGAIPVLSASGRLHLWMLFAAAVVVGAGNALFGAAYNGFLPALVAPERLVSANSRFEGSRVLAMLVGAALSGALVQLLSAPTTLSLDAASFLFSAVCISLISHAGRVPATPSPGFGQEIIAGVRFIGQRPILRTLLIMSGLFNIVAPMLNGQLVLYFTGTLGLPPVVLGVGMAIAGAGGVGMALLTPRITKRLGLGRSVIIAALATTIGWSLLPLAGGGLTLILAILLTGAVIGTMGDVLINISAQSLRQSITPDHLQGRVSAAFTIVVGAVQPIGALVGGVIAEHIGERGAIAGVAVGFSLAFLTVLFSPIRGVPSAVTPIPQPTETVPLQVP